MNNDMYEALMELIELKIEAVILKHHLLRAKPATHEYINKRLEAKQKQFWLDFVEAPNE